MLQKKCKYQEKGGLGTFEIQSCLQHRCQNSSPCGDASGGTGPSFTEGQEGPQPSLPWQACPLGATFRCPLAPPLPSQPGQCL